MFIKMVEESHKNWQLLITELLNKGIDYTRTYLSNWFNENIDIFNEFIINCKETSDSNAYDSYYYKITKFDVGDAFITKDMLCINYTFNISKDKNKPNQFITTHAYVDLNNNSLKFCSFGPNLEANLLHQKRVYDMLEREYREYKLKQLI